MGFLDLFGKKEERELTLDVTSIEKWPAKLIRQQGLDKEMKEFLQKVAEEKAALERLKTTLINPQLLERVPARTEPIHDEHLPRLVKAVDQLVKATSFSQNIFHVEESQEAFHEALATYREASVKSIAALKEFYGAELQQLEEGIEKLEDAVISISPKLQESSFEDIKAIYTLVVEYKETRKKESRLKEYRTLLLEELDVLEKKRIRTKEKIKYYMDRARNSQFKGLLAEEEELLKKADDIKVHFLSKEEEAEKLKPINQRLATLRKQMISDITALNINEQRTFLEAAKDDIRIRQRKLERVDEILAQLDFETYRRKFLTHLEPFSARIEDTSTILESEADDSPQ